MHFEGGLVVGLTQVNGVSRALIWMQKVMSDLPVANGWLGPGLRHQRWGDVAGLDFTT